MTEWLVPPSCRRLTPNRWWAQNRPSQVKPIEGVVYHYTAAGDMHATARWLCAPEAKASAHFIVGRDGAVLQLSPLSQRTWHAGGAPTGPGVKFLGEGQVNQRTIGIELCNFGPLSPVGEQYRTSFGVQYNGDVLQARHELARVSHRYWEPYPESQVAALEGLVSSLLELFPLLRSPDRHVGHSTVDPTRKMDPGPAFPWPRLRRLFEGRTT